MAKKSVKNKPTNAKKPDPKKSELDNLTLADGKTYVDPDIEKVKKERGCRKRSRSVRLSKPVTVSHELDC